MNSFGRTGRVLAVMLAALTLFAAVFVGSSPSQIGASSHREAPLIATDPYADTTDVYAFVSPDRPDSVTLIGDWIPFEFPEGGPNYYMFADDVRYEINIDNDGDALEDITYRFQFTSRTLNGETFLYNNGPLTTLDDENLIVTQSYSVTEVRTANNGSQTLNVLARNVRTPPVRVGRKSTPDYPALARMAIRRIGSGANQIRVFAGQRDDPFFVDLNVFDLLTLRGEAPPVGLPTRNVPLDGLKGYNVHSIAMQVPISRLTAGDDPVIGVWATSSRRAMRTLSPLGGVSQSGEWVQVSRLGMPLVNEVVIPRALKNAFNGLKPVQDVSVYTSTPLLQRSILEPELQRLLAALYGVPNPGANRQDIFEIFLQGIKTGAPFTIQTAGGPVELPANFCVNQPGCTTGSSDPSDMQPAEMLRLNTGIKGNLCKPEPDYELGLLGGDACGFPNGRRLQDDVTDIELLAVGGAAYTPVTGAAYNFPPALLGVLRDNVYHNDLDFEATFPYLATPHSGTDHVHAQHYQTMLMWVQNSDINNRRNGLQE